MNITFIFDFATAFRQISCIHIKIGGESADIKFFKVTYIFLFLTLINLL